MTQVDLEWVHSNREQTKVDFPNGRHSKYIYGLWQTTGTINVIQSSIKQSKFSKGLCLGALRELG